VEVLLAAVLVNAPHAALGIVEGAFDSVGVNGVLFAANIIASTREG
jgi:hypothetical protein